MKICSRCGQNKPLDHYSWKVKSKGQRQAYCKPCHNEYLRDRYDPNKKRKADLHSKYNMTEKDWGDLYLAQHGECKICNRPTVKLVVDHCHTTNKVRGLLCHSCNMGLGKFYDDPRLLKSAIKYLETFVKEGI